MNFPGLKIRVFSDRQAPIPQCVQLSEPDQLVFSMKRQPSLKMPELTCRPSDDFGRRRQIRDRFPGDSIRVPHGVGLIASRFKGSRFQVQESTRWTSGVSFPRNFEHNVTKFAPHKAPTLIA